jgi:hypothetical protein
VPENDIEANLKANAAHAVLVRPTAILCSQQLAVSSLKHVCGRSKRLVTASLEPVRLGLLCLAGTAAMQTNGLRRHGSAVSLSSHSLRAPI